MVARMIVGLAAGAGAGMILQPTSTRVLGGGCPLTCNPYAVPAPGAALGLLWAVGG